MAEPTAALAIPVRRYLDRQARLLGLDPAYAGVCVALFFALGLALGGLAAMLLTVVVYVLLFGVQNLLPEDWLQTRLERLFGPRRLAASACSTDVEIDHDDD